MGLVGYEEKKQRKKDVLKGMGRKLKEGMKGEYHTSFYEILKNKEKMMWNNYLHSSHIVIRFSK